jgi:hypothetical protein
MKKIIAALVNGAMFRLQTLERRLLYAAIVGTIICLGSCSKENLPTPTTISTGNPSPVVLNLVASHWILNEEGHFSTHFDNIFQSVHSGSSTMDNVRVYVVWEGQEYQMFDRIAFLGGELEALHTDNDLTLNYQFSSNELPFKYLNVKVVIGRS